MTVLAAKAAKAAKAAPKAGGEKWLCHSSAQSGAMPANFQAARWQHLLLLPDAS